jgi:hypothetical protein
VTHDKIKKTARSSGIYSQGTLFGTVENFDNGFGEGTKTIEKNHVQNIEPKGCGHTGRCPTVVQSPRYNPRTMVEPSEKLRPLAYGERDDRLADNKSHTENRTGKRVENICIFL